MSNLKEIKDAARQAFRDQQSQDTEGGVPDIVSFCAGFLAGYRHRQSEIAELTSVLDLKKETIVEMQNAYETLDAHDEMLIATVDKLKEELLLAQETARSEAQFVNELQEENKKLRECVEFYADENKWGETYHLGLSEVVCMDLSIDTEKLINGYFVGGKLARQCLKELDKK